MLAGKTHWAFRPDGMDERFREFLYGSRRRAGAVRLLDTDWPRAPRIRDQLKAYVTDGLLTGKSPVLHELVDHGINAYEKELGTPDKQRILAFARAAEEVFVMRLSGVSLHAGEAQVWRPELGVPLLDWLMIQGGMDTPLEVRRAEVGKAEREAARKAFKRMINPLLPAGWLQGERNGVRG